MIRGAVLGLDVSRSRSPAIHHAAYRALGLTGSYRAFNVDAAGFAGLVRSLGKAGYDYLNVTIPHKRQAAELAGRAAPLVRSMAAANTLIFGGSGNRRTVRAENTDGYGLITALADLGSAGRRGSPFRALRLGRCRCRRAGRARRRGGRGAPAGSSTSGCARAEGPFPSPRSHPDRGLDLDPGSTGPRARWGNRPGLGGSGRGLG